MVKLKNEIKRQYFHWILYIMDFSIYKAGLTCFPQWEKAFTHLVWCATKSKRIFVL